MIIIIIKTIQTPFSTMHFWQFVWEWSCMPPKPTLPRFFGLAPLPPHLPAHLH